MNKVLAHWNTLNADSAAHAILPCCGSLDWAKHLAAKRPIADEAALIASSNAIWRALPEQAWHEAFNSHPRIGEQKPQTHATTESLRWSAEEQRTAAADGLAKEALAEANRRYEQKFARIFIICAAGKTSAEILASLTIRINNDPSTELHESAEQQRQITELRLHRWLNPS